MMNRQVRTSHHQIIRPRRQRQTFISLLTDSVVADRIIDHLRLTFVANRPPAQVAYQEVLMAAKANGE